MGRAHGNRRQRPTAGTACPRRRAPGEGDHLTATETSRWEVALAARFGVPTKTYSHITPTIYGGAETLPSQSPEYLVPTTARKPFQGCDAGRTAFHVNPHAMASMCKVGREPNVPLLRKTWTKIPC